VLLDDAPLIFREFVTQEEIPLATIFREVMEFHRHLVEVRQTDELSSSQRFGGIQVISPVELIGMKVMSLVRGAGRPKGGTDFGDVQIRRGACGRSTPVHEC